VSGGSAGAGRSSGRVARPFRHGARVLLLGLIALAAAGVAGCSSGDSTPERLLDGTPASPPPIALEGLDRPVVLTSVRVVSQSSRQGTMSVSCLRARDWDVRPAARSVERVTVSTRSVTFEEASGRGVFGCSHSLGARGGGGSWCGSAWGRLHDGLLRDPRLDLVCGSIEDPVAFAWVQPASEARWVSVEQPGFVEVYEVAGDLPVRVVTTSGVDHERSSASFLLFEHDAQGRLVRQYRLAASAAG
jgi:hypothetical protein